jgi:hypothetical protein
MAKQVFDMLDLRRLIYSFGSAEHRALIKKVNERYKYVILSPIPAICIESKKMLPEFFPNKVVVDMIDFFLLLRCKCCSRHCHRKPNIVLEEEQMVFLDDYGPRVPEDKDFGMCDCECRHRSRCLIRTFQEIYIP